MAQAFKKYLGAGKAGDIKEQWADIPTVVSWIREAGGVAVLAHPLKYKLTRTKLVELLGEFADAGGEGMEVISGRQVPSITKDLSIMCNKHGLLASCGSDFHSADQPWAALGKVGALPESCMPVMASLALSDDPKTQLGWFNSTLPQSRVYLRAPVGIADCQQ